MALDLTPEEKLMGKANFQEVASHRSRAGITTRATEGISRLLPFPDVGGRPCRHLLSLPPNSGRTTP